MDARTYTSPRDLRTALAAAHGDWTAILSPAQLDMPLMEELWGGFATLRAWLADGAGAESASVIWKLVRKQA